MYFSYQISVYFEAIAVRVEWSLFRLSVSFLLFTSGVDGVIDSSVTAAQKHSLLCAATEFNWCLFMVAHSN